MIIMEEKTKRLPEVKEYFRFLDIKDRQSTIEEIQEIASDAMEDGREYFEALYRIVDLCSQFTEDCHCCEGAEDE